MTYPFTAIVGQERMRLALLLNAIDPGIGGVLIRGERGTAKSTMARSLAALLPELRVVASCPYGCDPDESAGQCAEHRALAATGTPLPLATRPVRVVELPINATEDRLAGTLDIEAALTRGEQRFQPGLLAAAHRGILYVDEVNLLPDHLVDLLLDAAAMGRNTVEREGVSVSHPARFILIGTMNPEEGELRPQLLDRFGLCVEVAGLPDLEARVEVMRRRAAQEADPAVFAAAWHAEQEALRERVREARRLLPAVRAPDPTLRLIAGVALELAVDGHRADLVMLRAARTIAAFEGRSEVSTEDVRRAAELALPHRMRRRPFEQERFTDERLDAAMERAGNREPGAGSREPGSEGERQTPDAEGDAGEHKQASVPPREAPASAPLPLPSLDLARDRTARQGSGRRQRTLAGEGHGRAVRAAQPDGPPSDIAVAATVRAAAQRTAEYGIRNAEGGEHAGPHAALRPEDLRVAVRERKVGANIVFIVDASGSMGARRRMAAAKGAALTLLTEAYQRRDRVALIAFRGAAADLLLPLTDSVELAQQRLAELPTGGRTPLAAGLRAGLELVRQVRLKDPRAICVPVLLTDGGANVAGEGGSPPEEALALAAGFRQPGVHPLVLDTERDGLTLGLAARLADRAGARYVRLADLSGDAVAASVQSVASEAAQ